MNQPTTPTANAILADQSANLRNLEILQKHFPSAIEIAPDGRYTVNAAQLQLALDPAGVKVEEDGFELRWVGKREAYNTAFTPAQNILEPLREDSKNWDTSGNLLIKGDNLDALRLLRHSYFGKVKLIYIDPPYNTQSDAFIYNDNFGVNQTQILEDLGYDKDNIEYIKNIYGARTHSGWLSFMYPRLLLAKDLLRDDGVIFISIDDNEQAQLKLLCDEVFGQDNFVATIVWQNSSRQSDQIANEHEYMHVYGKTAEATSSRWTKSRDIAETLNTFVLNEKQIGKSIEETQTALVRKIDELLLQDKESGNKDFAWLGNYKNIDSNWQIYYAVDLSGEGAGPPRIFNDREVPAPAGRHWMGQDYIDQLLEEGRIVWRAERAYRKLFITESEDNLKSVVRLPTRNGSEEIKVLLGKDVFGKPKPHSLIKKLCYYLTKNDDLILDFFAGSGTTGEAVMRLNAEDGGNRKFILVQIPQAIDPKKQKEAHKFVTEELGKPATIFEITAERLRRAGEKVLASQATTDKASQTGTAAAPVDIGFRVFEVAPDLDALIFQKPLSEVTQADLAHFEAAALAANPAQQALRQERVLHNLLLAEGLPLTTRITEVLAGRLYLAADVAIFLGAVSGIELADTLAKLKTSSNPPVYLTVYAPWIADDNFLQNIKTQAESLGYSGDKLRLRG